MFSTPTPTTLRKRPILPPLVTSRLELRELEAADFAAVHAYASDPDVVQYMPWGPNTEADTHEFLARAQTLSAARPRLGYELGIERREDGVLLGAMGLHRQESNPAIAGLGYCFAKAAWGHGYATESARAMLRFGFSELELHRIWAGCDVENRASARVLEKIGMRKEGHLRQDTLTRGEWRDTLLYGLVRDDWLRLNET